MDNCPIEAHNNPKDVKCCFNNNGYCKLRMSDCVKCDSNDVSKLAKIEENKRKKVWCERS